MKQFVFLAMVLFLMVGQGECAYKPKALTLTPGESPSTDYMVCYSTSGEMKKAGCCETCLVHIAGTETITGAKTFSALATFSASIDVASIQQDGNVAFILAARGNSSVPQTTFSTGVEIKHDANGDAILAATVNNILLAADTGELFVQNSTGPANIRVATVRATTGMQCAVYTPYTADVDNVFRTHAAGFGHDLQDFGSKSMTKTTTGGNENGRWVTITATRVHTGGALDTGFFRYGGADGLSDAWHCDTPLGYKTYSQDAEPDIPNDTTAIWNDTNAGPIIYLLVDIGGTQYKRALDS